jgi:hypothetical protein
VRRLIAFCTACGFGFVATVLSFRTALASSGFERSICAVVTRWKNRCMKPIRARRITIGRRSAPFLNRPRTRTTRNSTRIVPRTPSGIQSHHMAGRLPTSGQEDARCDDRRQHDGREEPARDRPVRDGGGGDCVEIGE